MPPAKPSILHLTSVFLGLGVVVIGTTWDVHRHIKANEQPVTAQQQADFEAWLAQRQQSGGAR